MPAEPIVKLFRDHEPLLGTRSRSERGRDDERQRIAKRRTEQEFHAGIWQRADCARLAPGSGSLRRARRPQELFRAAEIVAKGRAPPQPLPCSRRASGPSRTVKVHPAMSATLAVSSCEPPSTTSTSLTRPAVAPETSAAKVDTRARSESRVAMMTLSIRCASRVRRGSRCSGRRFTAGGGYFQAFPRAHEKLFLFCSQTDVSFRS